MLENKNVVLKPALSHDAFWHLQAIGVLPYRPEPPSPSAERDELPIWRRLEGANAVVAIIDTGVSGHPYLFERLEPPYNIDLTGAPTLVMPEQKASRGEFAGMTTEWLSGMGLYRKEETAPFQKVLKDLVEKYERKRTFDYGAPPAANQKFAAHGTSCAGLVAASSKHGPERKVLSRPYYRGVDPNSKIMSITTSFAPNPELLTLAFLLAAKKRADVILFPRGLPREIMNDDPNLDKDHFFEWQALKQTILAVSKIIPIVCAAGNECVDQAIAPACFANDDNGIIGVAAANYFGVRSSYSNFGNGVTITAPSDDAEMFNVDQARLDKTDRFYGEHPYQTFIQNFGLSDVLYGEASIRAIDVPGPFGFTDTANNSIADDVENRLATDPESYFTDFGGTSAAAAIVAGVAALIQRARKKAKNEEKAFDGIQVRKVIVQTARGKDAELLHLPAKKLATDKVNGETLGFPQAFGAGMVAADIAVEKILAGWTP